VKLTAKQVECLRFGVELGSIYPWDFGSTTIAKLKRGGMIAVVSAHNEKPKHYVVTDAGRAALAEASR
jgi:DNA-binding PadR family transcriptional regulator